MKMECVKPNLKTIYDVKMHFLDRIYRKPQQFN